MNYDYFYIDFFIDTDFGEKCAKLNKFSKFCIKNDLEFHYDKFVKSFEIIFHFSEDTKQKVIDFAESLKLQMHSAFPTNAMGFYIG